MKRLAFLISLLITGQALAYGTAKEDTSTAITFVHSVGMDSVRYYASQDTTSWEIDRLMVRAFAGDSTNYALIDTFDNPGTYFVKIEYWEGGAASAKYLPDIRDVAPANADVNVIQVSGSSNAADSMEANYKGDVTTLAERQLTIAGDVENLDGWQPIITRGSVDAGSFSDTTFTSVALPQINDYWNRSMIYFFTGSNTGLAAVITDFVASTDSVVYSPATRYDCSVGDSFAVLTLPAPYFSRSGYVAIDLDNTNGTLVVVASDTLVTGDTIAVMPNNWVAADSTAYQGEAAGLDSSAVAGAVRDVMGDSISSIQEIGEFTGNWGLSQFEDSIFHDATFKTGSFYPGIFADNAIDNNTIKGGTFDSSKFSEEYWHKIANRADSGAGAESGVGIYACSIWVYDTGNTVMVSGIMVQAENSSGANQGRNRSNVSGISILNLNDGDYNLRIPMNSGYIQTTNPQPFTVSGATNDTIDVIWFSPSDPEGDLCATYNYVKDANDNGIAGVRITATIPTNFWPITYQGQAVKAIHTTTTDGNGLWQLPVFPNGFLLTADGDSASYYQYTADGQLFGHMGIKVTVPDSVSFFMVPDAD